jgi:hypothetical protein
MSELIPFQRPGKPEQLSIDEVRKMKPEDIERAREGGHLDQVMGRIPKPDPSAPRTGQQPDPFSELAREIVNKARP